MQSIPRLLVPLALSSSLACAAPGSLDTGFNSTGVSTVGFGTTVSANAVAAAPGGKIVVAGTVNVSGSDADMAVLRYDADGSLDTTFGGDGGVAVNLGASGITQDSGLAAFVQADGKILVTGSSGNLLAIVRFNVDGSLDTFFGQGGKVFSTLVGSAVARAVAVENDGSVLIVASTAGGGLPVLQRYSAGGKFKDEYPLPVEKPKTLRLQPDGKILVVGAKTVGGISYPAIARVSPTGIADPSFDGDGVITLGMPGDEATAIAVDGDRLLVAGTAGTGAAADFFLSRYSLADGAADPSFPAVRHDLGGSDLAKAMVVQADGRIVLGGVTNRGGDNDFALVRFVPGGGVDPTFGPGGEVVTRIGTGTADAIASLALDSRGKLLAAGSASASPSESVIALARYNTLVSVDLSVGLSAKAPLGVGIVNITAEGQTRAAPVKKRGGRVTAFIRIRNKGHDADSFRVRGLAGNSGFVARYYHGGQDVTAAVVSGKLRTGPLAAGQSYLLELRITAATSVAGKVRRFPVRAVSLADSSAADAVMIAAASL